MPLLGGALIGLASSIYLLGLGGVCGISGIVGGLVARGTPDTLVRVAFTVGLIVGGVLLMFTLPGAIQAPENRTLPTLVLAGLLVGFGTQMGNGCTSGHGICGITRKSPRSIVATITFMLAGGTVATVAGALLRGGA